MGHNRDLTLLTGILYIPDSGLGQETARSEFFISVSAPSVKGRKSTPRKGICPLFILRTLILTPIRALSPLQQAVFGSYEFLISHHWRRIDSRLQTSFVLSILSTRVEGN